MVRLARTDLGELLVTLFEAAPMFVTAVASVLRFEVDVLAVRSILAALL